MSLGILNLNWLLWLILVLYYSIYYQYICVTSSMLGDVVYSDSVNCVKTYFLQSLKYSVYPNKS